MKIGALLLNVSSLLEEIIETLEILEDVTAGGVRDYDEFIKELGKSGEI